MLFAPGAQCYIQAYIYIDGLQYNFYDGAVTAPAGGETMHRDYTIDVTAASISGTALLQGIDVTSASVYAYASSPSRNQTCVIPDVSTGLYTLGVDAGDWYLRPRFNFNLPGDLSGLTGYLYHSYTPAMSISAGDQVTDIDFIITPGFIPGTLNLWGANTNFNSARVTANNHAASGSAHSYVDPDTGEFMFVCSAGDWQTDYYQYLSFDYPDDPDSSLSSSVWQRYYNSNASLQTVTAGQTTPRVDLTYGTITVRREWHFHKVRLA